VVVALGGTTLPVLMGETYHWQFALQDRNVAAAYALVILAISIAFDARLPARAACSQGSPDMSAAPKTPPPRVADARKRRPLPVQSASLLLCAWVLVPIYLLMVNALSAPAEVTAFPKRAWPSFDFGSLQFFLGFRRRHRALWNSVLVAVADHGAGDRPRRAGRLCAVALRGFPGKEPFRMLV
jgi:ABC-type Fe3+ transport system permease subunit